MIIYRLAFVIKRQDWFQVTNELSDFKEGFGEN